MSNLSHNDQTIRRQSARAVAQSRRSAWVLLECLGEEPERGDMPWADDAEVLAVYCRDLREVQALGDRDHGRIDDAERKAHVLLDEFRDARDIAFLDFSNVEASMSAAEFGPQDLL
jgi:hypothetical protein